MFVMLRTQMGGMDSVMGMESLSQFFTLLKLIFVFLIVAIIIVVIYLVYRGLSKDKRKRSEKGERSDEEILNILKRRYARGEITREEFQERKEELIGK